MESPLVPQQASGAEFAGALAPVCDCDGETYSNESIATTAGTNVAFSGACDRGGTICGEPGGATCPPTQFCDYTGRN
ncbi:MAG: hypothetical protein AAGA56_21055 [Myxococcota bacterium]